RSGRAVAAGIARGTARIARGAVVTADVAGLAAAVRTGVGVLGGRAVRRAGRLLLARPAARRECDHQRAEGGGTDAGTSDGAGHGGPPGGGGSAPVVD